MPGLEAYESLTMVLGKHVNGTYGCTHWTAESAWLCRVNRKVYTLTQVAYHQVSCASLNWLGGMSNLRLACRFKMDS